MFLLYLQVWHVKLAVANGKGNYAGNLPGNKTKPIAVSSGTQGFQLHLAKFSESKESKHLLCEMVSRNLLIFRH